jgi:hypothetical protein
MDTQLDLFGSVGRGSGVGFEGVSRISWVGARPSGREGGRGGPLALEMT